MRTTISVAVAFALMGASVALGQSDMDAGEPVLTADELEFFEMKIRPVLIEHCYRCHSEEADRIRGDFKLDTRDSIRRMREWGAGVIPGDPEHSLVMEAIRYEDENFQMPPDEKLPDRVIADFERWIRMGAPDPRGNTLPGADAHAGATDIESGREFWSFQKPADHEPPKVENSDWPKDDVDRFLLAAMEEHNLRPVRDADRTTLIRRLTFDLTGLPPTPEEVEDFVHDRSPLAVEALVDRLLASPQFGERWGRHWLDVARYAESSGKETNIVYPHAWRYRDYVIQSFNENKPFDRFLTEQLAGDLLPADDPTARADHIIATGFLALGPKSQRTRNEERFALEVADEQIDAMSRGMLGLTIACARCHDHKFDPIPTRDYYAMAGIFLSTETMFGTPPVSGTQSSALISLPAGAEIENGVSLSLAELDALERRRAETQAEVQRLLEETRSSERRGTDVGVRIRRLRNQIVTLDEALARYDNAGQAIPVAMGVREARRVRDAHLLVRGDLENPAEQIPRGFLQVLSDEFTPTISGRASGRRELASWVASDDNPLTARVWVNRVWLHLFGAGLVATPDNFGFSGLAPSHPELLDHLAVSFMEDGWSTKDLIRRLVLTRAYQMGSTHDARNNHFDPDNVYLWRMPSRRLEAEALRDAMLAAAGTLDLNPPVGSPVATIEGTAARTGRAQAGMDQSRSRSVYLPVLRNLVPEVLDTFDFAEPGFVTGQREVTNVPTQALYLLNDDAVIAHADAMASRLLAMPGSDTDRLEYAFALTLGREPSSGEASAVKRFFSTFGDVQHEEARAASGQQDRAQRQQRGRQNARQQRGRGPGRRADPEADTRHVAWSAFCQSLFASAEFRYIN